MPRAALEPPPRRAPSARAPAPRPAAGAPAARPGATAAPTARLGLPRHAPPASVNEERTMIMAEAPARPPVNAPPKRSAPAPFGSQPSSSGRAPVVVKRAGPSIQRIAAPAAAPPSAARPNPTQQSSVPRTNATQQSAAPRPKPTPQSAPGARVAAPWPSVDRASAQGSGTEAYTQPPVAMTPAPPPVASPPLSQEPLPHDLGAAPPGHSQRPALHQGLPPAAAYELPANQPVMAPSGPSAPQHFAQQGPDASQPLQLSPSAFPSHFAPPRTGAPPPIASTARSSVMPPRGGPSAAFAATSNAPPDPGAIVAASVFLGLPLAVATLVVAVLALR
jgi:DNA polymerase III subunit gamma/tau